MVVGLETFYNLSGFIQHPGLEGGELRGSLFVTLTVSPGSLPNGALDLTI